MTAALAKKVAFRREHTGDPAQDRAQRLAQQVAMSHEQTKSIVAALANSAFVALVVDKALAGSAGVYTLLLTATITTVLANGNLDVTFTASGTHPTTANATTYFKVFVDGVFVKGAYVTNGIAAGAWTASIAARAAVKAGAHTVTVQWSTDNNSARINAASNVNEHAGVRLQEAA